MPANSPVFRHQNSFGCGTVSDPMPGDSGTPAPWTIAGASACPGADASSPSCLVSQRQKIFPPTQVPPTHPPPHRCLQTHQVVHQGQAGGNGFRLSAAQQGEGALVCLQEGLTRGPGARHARAGVGGGSHVSWDGGGVGKSHWTMGGEMSRIRAIPLLPPCKTLHKHEGKKESNKRRKKTSFPNIVLLEMKFGKTCWLLLAVGR